MASSAPRRFGAPLVIGVVVVLTLGVGIVAIDVARGRKASLETAKAWDVQGPPCPAFTEVQFTDGRYAAKKTFDYDGVTIGRLAGDVSCSDVKDSGGKGVLNDKICQFTSPANLTVSSRAGKFYFVPDVGHPATLAIHRGVPKCVMGSTYTLKTE